MNPIAPALGMVACIAVAVRAVQLITNEGPAAARFARDQHVPRRHRQALSVKVFERMSTRLAGRALDLLGQRRRASIRQRLDAAGCPGGLTVERFAGRKASCTLLAGAFGGYFIVQGKTVIGALVMVVGFFWMDVWLNGKARRRQARIDRDLPDFLDVVAVTVGAGVGFRPALARVSEKLGGPIGDEIATTLRQMDLGSSRRAAFTDLRRRNTSESLGRMVSALLQAEELGAPLTDTLISLGGEMRRFFSQDARQRASRAAPRVSLIITMVMVPGCLVIMVVGLFLTSGIHLGNFGG